MRDTHTTHSARRLPPPTATPGSLLDLIQLANHQGLNWYGAGNRHSAARQRCLAAAETHAAVLDASRAREGLRSFVENCDAPWDGLWRQVAPVIGAEVEVHKNTALSTAKKSQRLRALPTDNR